MRTIKVEALSKEAFAPFGAYYDMASPEGYALAGELHRFSPTDSRHMRGDRLPFRPFSCASPMR